MIICNTWSTDTRCY